VEARGRSLSLDRCRPTLPQRQEPRFQAVMQELKFPE
jgi:hypothetical protein